MLSSFPNKQNFTEDKLQEIDRALTICQFQANLIRAVTVDDIPRSRCSLQSLEPYPFFTPSESMSERRRSSMGLPSIGNDDYVLDNLDLETFESSSNHFAAFPEGHTEVGKTADTVVSPRVSFAASAPLSDSQIMQDLQLARASSSESRLKDDGSDTKRSFSDKCAEIIAKKRRIAFDDSNVASEASFQPLSVPSAAVPVPAPALSALARSVSAPPLRLRPFQVEQWSKMYAALIEFKQIFGHCSVPHNYPENQELARWVKRQRYQWKRWKQQQAQPLLDPCATPASMTQERVQALESIGFVFDSHSDVWESRYRELIDYKRANGHCCVPVNYPANKQLASWVKSQRHQYRHCKAGTCSGQTCSCQRNATARSRIQRLDEIGFDWNPTRRAS